MRKVFAWLMKGTFVAAIAAGVLMPSDAFARKHKSSNGSLGSSGSSGGSYGSHGSSGGSHGSSGGSSGSAGHYGSNGSSGGSYASHGSSGSSGGGHTTPAAPAAPMAPAAPEQPQAAVQRPSAMLVMSVPESAVVYLMGQRMTLTGTTRRFRIPLKENGKDYGYQIRVETARDGQTLTAESTPKIRSGHQLELKVVETDQKELVAIAQGN